MEGDEDTTPKKYKETFKNNRAQYYTSLANRFYNTYRCVVKGVYVDPDDMISIDSEGVENIGGLRAQVCRIPTKANSTGLIQIMNKKEMAALKIPSPNSADVLMMSGYRPPAKKVVVEEAYSAPARFTAFK